MKRCILILTLCILSASAAFADDYYYVDNTGGSDYYMQLNDNHYQSLNTGTSYTVNDDKIYGSDGSYYKQDNNMIYDMQTGDSYYNNNGYVYKF